MIGLSKFYFVDCFLNATSEAMVFIPQGDLIELAVYTGLPVPIVTRSGKEGLRVLMQYVRSKQKPTKAVASTDTEED